MLLLGIDGGGTRTRAVLVEASRDENGALRLHERARGEAGSCNCYSAGWDAAISNLLAAAHTAGAFEAGPDEAGADTAISWGLGLAGVVLEDDARQWRERLRPHLPPGTRLSIGDDALAAQSGAFEGGPGAILIAGTGANGFGRDASGRTARADGLGPLLGDRGSGYWIGESALRAATRHHDGVAHCPALHRAVLSLFGVPSIEALIPIVYGPAWTKDQAAALVPAVAQAAQDGDEHALSILRAAGTELAHTAGAVLNSLGLHEVALVGGVLENVPAVRLAFEEALRAAISTACITAPRRDAAVGAALLALEA